MHESAWQTFGRLHVLVIHFPIALIIVAATIDVFRRRSRAMAPGNAAFICLVLGAIGAVVASVMGWADADRLDYKGSDAELVFIHRWVGIGSAAAAVAAAYMAVRLRNTLSFRLDVAYRTVLLSAAIAVSVAGHYGGTLVHCEGYLFPSDTESEPINEPAASRTTEAAAEPADARTRSAGSGRTAAPVSKIDFKRDIEPILTENCIECHRPEKRKGKLRLDSKEEAMAGGAEGPCIVPGNSRESLLIVRVLGLGGEEQMPKGKAALSVEQIALLTRWIDEGAAWPER
jgi:uncharacterized membrane protein